MHRGARFLSSDEEFDALFPINIQQLSKIHWTPLNVARTAAQFLGPDPNCHILDVGAGVGKFCIAGSIYSYASFTGVEQRKHFVQAGNKVIRQLELPKTNLIHGNFTDIDMSRYTGIYFYNSFHENIVPADSLDEAVERSEELYEHYTSTFLAMLTNMPKGTRLATFWLAISEIPGCYKLCATHYNNQLKLWIKEV